MGTPAPYRNLRRDKPDSANDWTIGTVVSVDNDEKHATVDVTGSQWKVSIPGSVHGVKPGRSVRIRTVGNIRSVDSLMTVVPKETYNTSDKGKRSVDTSLAGTGGGTPSSPGGSASQYSFGTYISGFSVANASSNSTAEINKSRLYIGRLVTRFTDDTSARFQAIHNSLGSLFSAVESNRQAINSARSSSGSSGSSINELRQNVDELRKIVETLSSDLRDQGLLK